MRRGCPPSACYLNNGILSGEPRKSPRLIVLPSAGLQQCALSAADASVGAAKLPEPARKILRLVRGPQHRANHLFFNFYLFYFYFCAVISLIFTSRRFTCDTMHASARHPCPAMDKMPLYNRRCTVWQRSTMITAVLVRHMWVSGVLRDQRVNVVRKSSVRV